MDVICDAYYASLQSLGPKRKVWENGPICEWDFEWGGFFLPWEVALQVGWVAAGGVDFSGFTIKCTQFSKHKWNESCIAGFGLIDVSAIIAERAWTSGSRIQARAQSCVAFYWMIETELTFEEKNDALGQEKKMNF